MARTKTCKKKKTTTDETGVCNRAECNVGVNTKKVKYCCPTCQSRVYCSDECLLGDKDTHSCMAVQECQAHNVAELNKYGPEFLKNIPPYQQKPTPDEMDNCYKYAKAGNVDCQFVHGVIWAQFPVMNVLKRQQSISS